jgi:phosphate-selective porin OprO/OprP
LSILLTIVFLVLALQSDGQADSSPSADEGRLSGWLGKEIDWRLLGRHTYWKDGFRIDNPEETVTIKINGSMMIDGGSIDAHRELRKGFPNLEGEDVDLRRLRLSGLATLYDAVYLRMDIDFANVKEIKDNWIALRKKIPILGYVKAGHMKEPFSLEELTGGTNITFLERSLPTLAFAPGRNIGLMFNNTAFQDRMTWAAGGFLNTGSFSNVGDATDRISDANGCDLSGRVTGLPWYEEDGKKLLHLGLSYSHGFRNRDGEGTRFGPRPESYLTDDRLVDTGEFFTDRVDRVNMELAMVLGSLSFQGESLYAVVNAEGERKFWGGIFVWQLLSDGRTPKL